MDKNHLLEVVKSWKDSDRLYLNAKIKLSLNAQNEPSGAFVHSDDQILVSQVQALAEALEFGISLVDLAASFDINIGRGWVQFKEKAQKALDG